MTFSRDTEPVSAAIDRATAGVPVTNSKAEQAEASGLSSTEDFEHALAAVKQLQLTGALWWKLSSPNLISPRIDDEAASNAIGPKGSSERAQFDRIMVREIVPSLNIAAGTITYGFENIEQNLNDKQKKELARRRQLVKEELYTSALAQRLAIRRTSKGTALDDLSWDISIKKHDLGVGRVADIPYATVEFVLTRASSGSDFDVDLFRLLSQARDVFTFDCHLDDIDAILRDLSKLRDNLASLAREPKE